MESHRIEAYVDAAAAALDLPIAAAHRPGVLHYFGLAASMAALVNGLPLAPSDESAESFVPLAPDDVHAAAPR